MSKKIDKDALKTPDAFISASEIIFKWIEAHSRLILTLVLVGLVGGSAWVGYSYYMGSVESSAREALYQPESELKKAEAKLSSDLKDEGVKAPVATPDFAKDYSAIVEKIKGEVTKHATTKAALVSALNLSYFLLQNKQFEQALEVLDMPKYRAGQNELLGGFWFMQRGLVLLENKKVDPAIETYQTVLTSERLKSFHPEAILKLGVSYELKGDSGKAKEMYERLSREFPETEAAAAAQQYLRLMELKS